MKDLINELKEYKQLKKEVNDSFIFFSMCIEDDLTTQHYLIEYMASSINFIKEVDRYIDKKDSFNTKKHTDNNAIFEVNKSLLKYSLYKRRSIKSWLLTKIKGYHHP